MGGPFSVTFTDIYMVKMENEKVAPFKPCFAEDISIIYLTNVTKILKIFFLIGPTVTIKTSIFPLN